MATISVIVPVYNAEGYLNRCVESILRQTYADFELILVDDGSADSSYEMCKQFQEKDCRVRVFHKENGGHASARNKGIDLAFESDSQWITFIDSDDWVDLRYLEYLHKAVEEANTNISMCAYERVSLADEAVCGAYRARVYDAETIWCEKRINATLPCGKLFRKSLFNTLRWPQKCHDDEHMTYLLLFSNPKVAFVDAALYRYYYNTNSVMSSGWSIKHIDSVYAIRERRDYFFKNGYQKAYELDCRLYLEELYNTLLELEKAEECPADVYRDFRKSFKKELCKNAKGLGYSWNKYKYMYVYAYPALKWFAILESKITKLTRRSEYEK